jgi:hypothetical protein
MNIGFCTDPSPTGNFGGDLDSDDLTISSGHFAPKVEQTGWNLQLPTSIWRTAVQQNLPFPSGSLCCLIGQFHYTEAAAIAPASATKKRKRPPGNDASTSGVPLQ